MAVLNEKYYTIERPATGIFKDKGSKFLSFAWPVSSESEIKELIANIKSQYFDARHHCFAYRLGADKLIFRANDDGEPSGTGGKPILGQLISNDLTNILVVVVRYFGGTLLGTSGLINAYRNATADAIANASVVEKYVFAKYILTFDYQVMNQVMKLIKDQDIDTSDQNFGLVCTMKLHIKKNKEGFLLSRLNSIEKVKAEFIDYE